MTNDKRRALSKIGLMVGRLVCAVNEHCGSAELVTEASKVRVELMRAVEEELDVAAIASGDDRFLCFECGDGSTPLYCLNCAKALNGKRKPNQHP